MHILVTVASKHGASAEIGETLGTRLHERGLEVTILPPEAVDAVSPYDAVIIGSAVYAGHWRSEAVDLARREGAALRRRPVWLFSSGPLGSPPVPAGDPVDVADVMARTGAREHRVFAGELERDRLGFGERAVVGMVRAPYGDYRDWPSIGDWADEIASQLLEPAAAR